MVELATECLPSNPDAVNFFCEIAMVGHFFDDLIDRDVKISNDDIYDGLWKALVVLPRNRFYRNNFDELNPILCNAILNWKAANEMEATNSESDKEIAFIIRSEYANLLIHSALLVGGPDWASKMTPKIRRFWHSETFAGYKENLAKQFAESKENQLCVEAQEST